MAGNEQLQINPPLLTSRRIYDYGEVEIERFTLGPGGLTVDDATTICLMEKPKDLQRWYVLFQFPLQEQLIGLTFQICTSC